MIEVLSVENMRKSDAATIAGGIPGRELMYRAGLAVYNSVTWKAPVAVVCGVGNNGGDGYVIAGLLKDNGIDCTLILTEERFSEDGRYYFDKCLEKGIPYSLIEETETLSGFNTIVDCILGTGFKGVASGKAETAIEKINDAGAYVVSVDINSGLNGDSGMCGGVCVHSDLTVSVGSFKPGLFLNMAKDVMKEKINCDIGISPVDKPYHLIEKADIARYFGPRPNFSNKGTYGYTAIVGGSKKYSGALRLAAMANTAMRAGAGVVKAGVPASLYHDLLPLILESTLFPITDDDGEMVFVKEEIDSLISNVKTAAFGMGIGVSAETGKILEYLLENFTGTLIVDADGLTLLSKLDREKILSKKCRLVLTPHIKEFERLSGHEKNEILEHSIDLACEYALDIGAVVLLKGPSTIVTDGTEVYIVDAGCSGMATAGSGDVLSGILSATCAYIPDTLTAVAAGAYINGKAGEAAQDRYGSVSMVASDTVTEIAGVIAGLSKQV